MAKRSHNGEDKSSVARSRHYVEIRDCLASGWSAQAVLSWLDKRYGGEVLPSLRSIQRWKKRYLPEGLVMPYSFIQEKLKGLDYKVDVVANLSRLIPLLEDRLGRALEQEVTKFGGLPLGVTDNAVRVYLETLCEYIKAAQDTGLLPQRLAPIIDMSRKTLIATPELLKDMRETARELAKLELDIESQKADG